MPQTMDHRKDSSTKNKPVNPQGTGEENYGSCKNKGLFYCPAARACLARKDSCRNHFGGANKMVKCPPGKGKRKKSPEGFIWVSLSVLTLVFLNFLDGCRPDACLRPMHLCLSGDKILHFVAPQ